MDVGLGSRPDFTDNGQGGPPELPPPREYKVISSATLATSHFELDYLINGLLVDRQPCILAGPKKALKTSLLIALSASLASGRKFLGKFNVNRSTRVLFMSGESGMATLQETAVRICGSMGVDLADLSGLMWSEELPQLGRITDTDGLVQTLQDNELEAVIIDPVYMTMSGADAGNLFIQGALLRRISEACNAVGATLILAHHTRKNKTEGSQFDPPELEDIAWAGFQEFARQWLLVGRRERYEPGTGEHALWLSVGGSAGHSGLWGVDVSEGVRSETERRHWAVDVRPASEARQAAADTQQRQKEQERIRNAEARDRERLKRLVDAMRKFPKGETKSVLRDVAGLSAAAFGVAIQSLLADGRVEQTTVAKNKREEDGWKLNDK